MKKIKFRAMATGAIAAFAVACLSSVTAFAAKDVAMVGDTKYASFEDALKEWKEGTTLTLLGDVSVEDGIDVSASSLTLDLNGYGIKLSEDSEKSVFNVESGASLTVKDGDEEKEHYYTPGAGVLGLAVDVSDNNGAGRGSFKGGYITGAQKAGCFYVSGSLVMQGGTIIGNDGSDKDRAGAVTLDKGSFELQGGTIIGNNGKDGTSVYSRNGGKLVVKGGSIIGVVALPKADTTATSVTSTDTADANTTTGTSDDSRGSTASASQDKLPASVVISPRPQTIKYDGKEHELVTEGTAKGGVLKYAVNQDAATVPESGWTTSIPKAKDAGTYYVWYRAMGDDEHTDSQTGRASVTITK